MSVIVTNPYYKIFVVEARNDFVFYNLVWDGECVVGRELSTRIVGCIHDRRKSKLYKRLFNVNLCW
jgi:hypothetical protein